MLKSGADSKRKAYACVRGGGGGGGVRRVWGARRRAVVWSKRPITREDVLRVGAMKDVRVAQRTPGARAAAAPRRVGALTRNPHAVRVLHRRALLTRRKMVHEMSMDVINDHYFVLNLTTSAGACGGATD